jgi:hypothetical protein
LSQVTKQAKMNRLASRKFSRSEAKSQALSRRTEKSLKIFFIWVSKIGSTPQ